VVSKERLQELSMLSIEDIDIDALSDLRDIHIDPKLPVKKRISSMMKQTQNPYIHRIGDYVVKVKFQEKGPTLNDRISEYIKKVADIYIDT